MEQLVFDFYTQQPQISAASNDELSLQIGEFAGPLDLLLHLIKQEKANIFDIPIAKITDEYLKYIRALKRYNISIAADFLVMAATLIEIKSKMLLPPEISEAAQEDEEDPRELLIRQLLEHQKFKNAAEMLYTKVTVEQSVFPRGKLESDESNLETNATVFDLLSVFQKILARRKEEFQLEIEREEVSLTDLLANLKKLIANGDLNLLEFFAEMRSKRELVTAFMAILEIVRTESVKLLQDTTFGDIILRKQDVNRKS